MNKIFLFSCLNVLFTRCIQSASRECEISLLYCSEECFYTAVFSDVGLQAVVSAGGPCAGAPLGPESGSRGPDEVQSGPDQTAAGTFLRATLHCCFACELEVERQYFVFCLCFVVFYVFFNQGYSTRTRLGFRRSKTSKEQVQEAAFEPATDTAVKSEFC